MLMRLTFFLSFLSLSLAAQSDDWQSYWQADVILGGAEAEGHLWLVTYNSVAKIDQGTGRETLLHFQNSPIPRYPVDVYSFDENTFALLGFDNQLVLRSNGNWITQTLSVSDDDQLRHIAGQATDGSMFLAANTRLYRANAEQQMEHLHYVDTVLDNRHISYAKLDQQDRLWVGTNNKIIQFAADGTLLQELEFDLEYFVDAELDQNDNLWLTTSNKVYLWLTAEQQWKHTSEEEIGINTFVATICGVTADRAIISAYDRVYSLRYANGAFQVEEWSSAFTPEDIPAYDGFLDQENQFWYLNYQQKLRQWSVSFESPKVSFSQPWLPVEQLTSLGLDPQGKVWVGGIFNAAYLSGGRWQLVPVDSDNVVPIGINDFTFNAAGNPLIGTGYLFFFGMPDCRVRQFNGTSWESQSDSIISNSFSPITDIHWDDDDNLWVLQSFRTVFFVRSQGEWYRLRTIDIPTSTTFFTCFTPDPAGGMWIGTDNGIRHYDGYVFTSVNGETLQSEGHAVVDIAIDDRGKKWVSLGDGGLRRETEEGWVVVNEIDDLAQNRPMIKVVCGKYPEVWVSLDWHGLLHFDGNTWEDLTIDNSGLIDNYVTDILRDHHDRMWFTHYDGISVYAPDRNPIKPYYLPDQEALGVYPNPGCCLFTITWRGVQLHDYHLQLHNGSGQLVRQWIVTADRSGEQDFSFSQGNLPAGNYFITMSGDEHQIGSETIVILR